ncbi:ABC transporter substrate-binding protein [Nitrosomonas sp.]|uniref:ABC transporter substrate-binding protein n=1 Tax=Nitrosomonas sp. TaxID=42353 RepID=UPI0025F3D5BB|nr:ABC transporter substrate-binding protein [Nitrosomonas sp.]
MKPQIQRLGILSTLLIACSVTLAANITDEIKLGRALYEGKHPFTHAPQVAGVTIPLSDAHCSACHGSHGEGRVEGGIIAPSVQWHSLTNKRSNLPGYDSAQQILSAIEKGIARTNDTLLTESMPRFMLTNSERDALIEYLRIIGTEAVPVRGVSADTIILGTVLPLTGTQAAAGYSILQGMQQRINAINATGGIFGRVLQLKSVDATTDGLDAATLDLIQSQDIFALVGSWLAEPSDGLIQALTASNTPSVGAIGMPIATQHHRLTTYLLPSVQQQIVSALALLQERCTSDLGSEIWYVNEKDLPAINPVSGAFSNTSVNNKPPLRVVHVSQVEQQLKKTIDSRLADKLIFLLPSDDIESIRSQLDIDTLHLCVATLASISGTSLQANHANRVVVFPVPQHVLAATDLWTALGHAAIGLIAEAIARSGRILDQDRLISVLDNPQEFEPIPGLSVRFTPKARHALAEGFIWQ